MHKVWLLYPRYLHVEDVWLTGLLRERMNFLPVDTRWQTTKQCFSETEDCSSSISSRGKSSVKPQSQLWSKICRERFVFANLLKSKRICCMINPYQVHTCYKTKNDILANDHNKLNLDFRWMRGRSPRHLLMSKTAQNTVRIFWWQEFTHPTKFSSGDLPSWLCHLLPISKKRRVQG